MVRTLASNAGDLKDRLDDAADALAGEHARGQREGAALEVRGLWCQRSHASDRRTLRLRQMWAPVAPMTMARPY